MKLTFFFILAIFGCTVMAVDYYSDMFDNTNVAIILKNERLFKPYLACLLSKGSCTADARAFKTILPDAIATNCSRCNPKQRGIARQVGRYLMENKPEAWIKIVEKYDPRNLHIEKFKKFVYENQ